MINWSTDEQTFKKEHPKQYATWRLIQLINYGLDGEKLPAVELKKHWSVIKKSIDAPTKSYLQFLLWGKRPSSTRISRGS